MIQEFKIVRDKYTEASRYLDSKEDVLEKLVATKKLNSYSSEYKYMEDTNKWELTIALDINEKARPVEKDFGTHGLP